MSDLTDDQLMALARPACGNFRWPSTALDIMRAAIAADRAQRAEPVVYLVDGRRYKVSHTEEAGMYIGGLPVELCGQWVALVDATDNKHMNYTAPPAAPVVPEGWKLVPVEPTPEMMVSAQKADHDHGDHDEWLEFEGGDVKRVYRAMLAAAPEPKP